MPNKKNKGSAKNILAGLVVGAVAGAITGILLAPKSGRALRKDLQKVGKKIIKEVSEKAEEAGDLTREKYHQLVEEAADVYRGAKEIQDKDVKEIVDNLKSRWPEIVKKIKK